jgi:prepilin-type N-terminal cleavage/methylation domain-containing protein
MQSRSGFTIVEVTIVTVIIAILATISVVAYTSVQRDARDNTRKGNTTVIAEGLETYYTKNGEYPSVRSIVNNYAENTGTAVAAKLGVQSDILKMPKMPGSASNALFSAAQPTNDYVSYIGASAVNITNCQTVITGGCDEFTLKYYEESGPLVTVESRHKGRPDSGGSAPEAAAKPSIVVGLSGANVLATATASACETASLTPKFSFHYRVNGGAWTAYSDWSSSNTFSIPGMQATHYDFQAATRCDNGPVAGESSPESDIASFDFPIGAPAAPSVSVSTATANAVATIAPVTCPAGTTAQYVLRSRTNDGSWSAYSAWSTTLSGSQTAAQGVKYGYQAQARCINGTMNGTAATGSEGTAVKAINTPTTPAISASTSGSTTTWNWTGVTCPAGTSAQYMYRYLADWGYTSDWYGPQAIGSLDWDTTSQGYQYTSQIQAGCYNSYTQSGFGAVSGASYIRPVAAPGATQWSAWKSGARTVYMQATASCGDGMYLYTKFREWSGDIKFTSGPRTGFTGWWSTDGSFRVEGYTDPFVGGIANNYDIPAASRYRSLANQKCVNYSTGRESAASDRTSPIWTFGSL